jgi:hypothetical protein
MHGEWCEKVFERIQGQIMRKVRHVSVITRTSSSGAR